jgi:hypothetical protein
MGGNAAPVINPANASAMKVRKTPGPSERRDTYHRRKAYPIHSAIPRADKRTRVHVLRRLARVGCNRYISFTFIEG